MSQKILQINMHFNGMTGAELREAWLPAAEPISAVGGLRWKVWLVDEGRREAGGIYLFEDEAAMTAFLSGPIVTGISADPSLSDITVKEFDIMEEHTYITRGPVRAGVPI